LTRVPERSIGLSAPWLEEREEELVLETIRSGQLSLGPMIDRFEAALADRLDAPYVAAVSSGTAGLHLCMRLAGIGPGDEVVTPSLPPRTARCTKARRRSSRTSTR
jgi:perosamine synthetase